jgi:hypothetical protein
MEALELNRMQETSMVDLIRTTLKKHLEDLKQEVNSPTVDITRIRWKVESVIKITDIMLKHHDGEVQENKALSDLRAVENEIAEL